MDETDESKVAAEEVGLFRGSRETCSSVLLRIGFVFFLRG